LCVAAYALPVRYLIADTLVVLTVLVVLGASGWALFRPDRAFSALRIAALALLAFGLLVIALAALGVSYLYGVQGDFGRGGVVIMMLIMLLALPYLVAYPVIQLLWLGRQKPRAGADA
jgi:hypothetical protein